MNFSNMVDTFRNRKCNHLLHFIVTVHNQHKWCPRSGRPHKAAKGINTRKYRENASKRVAR